MRCRWRASFEAGSTAGAAGSRCRDGPSEARLRTLALFRARRDRYGRRARRAAVGADGPGSIADSRSEPGQRALRDARGAGRLLDARADRHEHRWERPGAHGRARASRPDLPTAGDRLPLLRHERRYAGPRRTGAHARHARAALRVRAGRDRQKLSVAERAGGLALARRGPAEPRDHRDPAAARARSVAPRVSGRDDGEHPVSGRLCVVMLALGLVGCAGVAKEPAAADSPRSAAPGAPAPPPRPAGRARPPPHPARWNARVAGVAGEHGDPKTAAATLTAPSRQRADQAAYRRRRGEELEAPNGGRAPAAPSGFAPSAPGAPLPPG